MTDKLDIKLKNGDIIDINQTVNGRSLFVIFSLESLDVRYGFDLSLKYEYDVRSLLEFDEYEKEIEIIGNINDLTKLQIQIQKEPEFKGYKSAGYVVTETLNFIRTNTGIRRNNNGLCEYVNLQFKPYSMIHYNIK